MAAPWVTSWSGWERGNEHLGGVFSALHQSGRRKGRQRSAEGNDGTMSVISEDGRYVQLWDLLTDVPFGEKLRAKRNTWKRRTPFRRGAS